MTHAGRNSTRQPQRVLITGANGFIGSNLCRCFLERDLEVLALVRPTSDLHFLDGLAVTRLTADLSQRDSIRLPADLDFVIHAASRASESMSREEARRHIHDITVNLLDALREARHLKRFVYISSALVLGHRSTNISEARPGRPARGMMAYVRAKQMTEELLRRSVRERGLPVVILRPTDVYGPNDRTVSQRILRGIEEGWPLIVGGGKRLLNICDVDNVAQACLLACGMRGRDGAAYTLTDGQAVTWGQLLGGFQRRLGRSQRLWVPVAAAYAIALALQAAHAVFSVPVPMASFYPVARVARDTTYDISLTRQELGYQPRSDLERQLDAVVGWYLAEKSLGRVAMPARGVTA